MKIIGITGGVGSGKSALLDYIKDHYRAKIMLSDEAAHKVYAPGGSIYKELIELLESCSPDNKGDCITNEDSSINRKEMAARVFSEKGLLEKVNDLVHPAVRVYIEENVEKASNSGLYDYYFLEAALLIEKGYKNFVDEMWYIYTQRDVRIQRLKMSRGYSDEKIMSIMNSQLSEEEFRKGSDAVIDNSGSLEDAFRQIDSLLADRT